MTGQKWTSNAPPLPARRNGFSLTLRAASAVGIDAARMRLDPRRPITGDVDTDHALRLRIRGSWRGFRASIDGKPVFIHPNSKAVIVPIPAGRHRLVLRPPAR
jgi:hypothetical protein